MEQLLHYVWKHKMLPLAPLKTTDGREVEVIDPGLHNMHQGPDFFNAKLKIGGFVWVGNVEIHLHSSDWYRHRHDQDPSYNNVILHVVEHADCNAVTANQQQLPQVEIAIPQRVKDNYRQLLATDHYPPCYKVIPSLPGLLSHSWMAALQTERLEQKTKAINNRVKLCGGSWEHAYFVTLSRNFGFGVNGQAFEQWAMNIPLQAVGKHRDNLFQVEAIFMGQAGLLNPDVIPQRLRQQAIADDYFIRLRNEYLYLQKKFSLTPIDGTLWRFLRMRPQNFPHIRISQLANLYHNRQTEVGRLTDCLSVDDITKLLQAEATEYWQTHYTFGNKSPFKRKKLSEASITLLIINTAIPMLFALGRHREKETLCDRAFDLIEQLPAENNNITRMWNDCGLKALSAADSQALIQLKKEYCDRKDCLRCRFGYEYLKKQNI